MATVPLSLQPSGYATTVNQDGVTVVTDFKFIEFSWTLNPPTYRRFLGPKCPHCNGNFFRFIGDEADARCVSCNNKMDPFIEPYSKNDDIIISRFDILDL